MVFGALSHVLVLHPLLVEFTVQVGIYKVHASWFSFVAGAFSHVLFLHVTLKTHNPPSLSFSHAT